MVTFDLREQFATADLALPYMLDLQLRDALDTDAGPEITTRINEAITAQLAEHGVSPTGEWLGDWSPTPIIRNVLNQLAITADVTSPGHVWVDTLDGPVQGTIAGYDNDTEDADDNQPAIIATLATLGWEPTPDREWLDIPGGGGARAVRPASRSAQSNTEEHRR
jgi:hypothetical protein